MTRKTDPARAAHTARNDLRTLLRARIETAIADFANWRPTCPTRRFVTTANDCRINYDRILGMIDALEVIDGNTCGLWAEARRALDSALRNCPEPSSILP